MGVGVYSSDFNGTGGTFIVDGLVGGEDEYRKYVLENVPSDALTIDQWRTEVAGDPDADEDDYNDYLFEVGQEESADFETWQGDQVSALIEDIEATIKSAAVELGMSPEQTRNGRYTRAGFDDDFVLIASGRYVDVGWRSWEHDFVVGTGASSLTRGWVTDTDSSAGEIIDNTGLAPSEFCRLYGELADAVEAYFRMSLMRDGLECRYKTSGYTTSVYEAPEEGFPAALEALRLEVAALHERIPQSFHDGIIEADWADREEIVRTLVSGDVNSDTPVVVPLYDPKQESLVLYSTDRKRFVATEELPAAFAAAMQDTVIENTGTEELLEVPRVENTFGAWRSLQSRHHELFIVSMEEWIGVTGDEPTVEWRDADGQEWESDVIMSAPAAAPAP